MNLHRTARSVTVAALGLISAGLLSAASPDRNSSPYAHIATLPSVVDGQPLQDQAFDSATQRLYIGSNLGLFWSDLSEARPVIKGPLFKKRIRRIELAPDLGRVFYFTETEIGYVDVRNASTEPVTLVAGRDRAVELVYEPTRHEIYVSTETPRILVIDAKTGERASDIRVPGWFATSLEAVPGRVFMNVGSKNGIYQIDAATRTVTPWKITGKVVTPAYLDADPTGRRLFAVYDQFIVVLDVATAREIGRVTTTSRPTIAFDPGTGWLVASWSDWRPRLRIKAFTVDEQGVEEVSQMDNPDLGIIGLEPTSSGFIQNGHNSLLVWARR